MPAAPADGAVTETLLPIVGVARKRASVSSSKELPLAETGYVDWRSHVVCSDFLKCNKQANDIQSGLSLWKLGRNSCHGVANVHMYVAAASLIGESPFR